jgi:putative ABC transport system permease protein
MLPRPVQQGEGRGGEGEGTQDGGAGGTEARRTIAIDERLAAEAHLQVGDSVLVSAQAGGGGQPVRIAAIVARSADPAEIARSEYRTRMHLDQLQTLTAYADRVDRFAIRTVDAGMTDSVARTINRAAFGFRAYRSADVAVGTSRTFQVVRRFHRAIAVITIVASAVFLLCLLWLRVEERRRDVAALRLIGVAPRTIIASIVLEAAFVALVGSGVGIAVGFAGARAVNWHYQQLYHTPLTFALITPGILALAVGLSCVLGICAGWLAALRLVAPPPLALLGR